MALVEHVGGIAPAPAAPARTGAERAARADLRAQIDRLERELAHLAAATYPRLPAAAPVDAGAPGPRLLGLGELERVRDGLAARLTAQRAAAAAQAERQAEARELLERMYAEPAAYRGERLTNADIGLAGCTTYEVAPRLGIVGMLAGWWQVKVSSGCPLPGPVPGSGGGR
jgi:hypothetical protein